MFNKTISMSVSTLLLAGSTLLANTDNMANSLMKLRAQVEVLNTQISDEKDDYKLKMHSLSQQKSELEGMVSRNELKLKQITKELNKVQSQIQDASKNSTGIKPIVLQAIAQLQDVMKQSIPFKMGDRLQAVEDIKTQLQSSLITPQKALSLVYSSYEDEMRMTKENGLFKQTISLDGEAKLVQVARIGTAMMFFQTPNGTVGYVTKAATGWKYVTELDKTKQDEIKNIFDAFAKQIRTGYFSLPNALAISEEK